MDYTKEQLWRMRHHSLELYEALEGIVADLENVIHPNVLEATLEVIEKVEARGEK